ncbi:MAG: hypothetical protein ACLSDQ_06870 [Adlercreutzia equolifaciens]
MTKVFSRSARTSGFKSMTRMMSWYIFVLFLMASEKAARCSANRLAGARASILPMMFAMLFSGSSHR